MEINLHNIRDYSQNRQKQVDDYAFGGGAGMVMCIEPIDLLISKLSKERPYDEIIYLTPDGEGLHRKRPIIWLPKTTSFCFAVIIKGWISGYVII